jgi:nucleoside-diphosphate-sugar epimerase
MAEVDQVFLLGATSLVGRFLIRRLAAAGTPAVALSRTERATQPGLRWRMGDLTRPGVWTAPTGAGFAQVFSLSPIWLLSEAALGALHVQGMRRLVAFSSTSRFTKTASGSSAERETARALAEGEARVEAFCRDHGIGFTVLRPTLIYAEGQDGNVSRLAGLIQRFGVLPLPGGATGLRQPVHADDLAGLAIEAMRRDPTDRAYDIPGGETLSYRVMVERIFEGLGRSPRILTLPPTALRLGYALARPWLPGSTADMLVRIAAVSAILYDGRVEASSFGKLRMTLTLAIARDN